MAVQIVYTSASALFRGLLEDCAGTPVTSADCASIQMNIFRCFAGKFEVVEGYEKVAVPVALAISDTVQTDGHGNSWNFSYTPGNGTFPPFPVRGAKYIVEFIFTASADGSQSVAQVECVSR